MCAHTQTHTTFNFKNRLALQISPASRGYYPVVPFFFSALERKKCDKTGVVEAAQSRAGHAALTWEETLLSSQTEARDQHRSSEWGGVQVHLSPSSHSRMPSMFARRATPPYLLPSHALALAGAHGRRASKQDEACSAAGHD